MYDSEDKIDKLRVELEIELENGERVLGFLFTKHTQRVSDLLNDHREFLPFQSSDGGILHVRKAKIVRVLHLDQESAPDHVTDPYEVLGVPRHASDHELKEAYHALCRNYHPDMLHGLDLAPDLMDSAKSRMVRIIDAYKRIMKMRNGSANDGQQSESAARAAGFN